MKWSDLREGQYILAETLQVKRVLWECVRVESEEIEFRFIDCNYPTLESYRNRQQRISQDQWRNYNYENMCRIVDSKEMDKIRKWIKLEKIK